MRRREFITLLGGAAAALSPPLRAQHLAGTMARIGFLGAATPAAGSASAIDALRTGLRDFGYVEGRNIVIEFRWAEERYDRLPQLVRELVATRTDLLITHGTPGTRAAKQATSTIPIVMAISGDAVATIGQAPISPFDLKRSWALFVAIYATDLFQSCYSQS
jgi:putative ABC transport system substrate-binding protein